MATQSVWFSDRKTKKKSTSIVDLDTEVAVIGGGMTGITTAYFLAKAGRKVLLLEQGDLLQGDTGLTTAFFTYVTDTPLTKLRATFGRKKAMRVWQSGREILDEVERIVTEEKINCEFTRCPAFVYAADEQGRKRLQTEASLAKSLGFSVTFSDDQPAFFTHGAMVIPDQAKLNPVAYGQALAEKAEQAGAIIRENAHVHAVDGKGPYVITTSRGRVTAKTVVVATHSPIVRPVLFSMLLKPLRTYAAAAEISAKSLVEGIYWDTTDPYHYFRVDDLHGRTRLIMGGEDHATGESDVPGSTRFERLETYHRELLKDVSMTVKHRWSGQVFETVDGLPYIGAAGKDLYVATGYGGNGMTFSTIAGKMIAELIVNGDHPWKHLYKVIRPHGWLAIAKGGMRVTRQWLAGRKKNQVDDTSEIPKGSGRVVMEGGKPVAVYKNPGGKVTKCSAICTHLQCTVDWNDAEKSWDCPCHGSRFDTEGKVLNGPAIKPLPRL